MIFKCNRHEYTKNIVYTTVAFNVGVVTRYFMFQKDEIFEILWLPFQNKLSSLFLHIYYLDYLLF